MPASDDDDPGRPAPRDTGAASNGEASRPDADRTPAVASGDGDVEAKHRRPIGMIALCGVLVLAVVGLGIWALSAQSDASDTQKKLDAATAAAAGKASQSQEPTATPQATATATATPPPAATPDAATQQAIDELTAALGATNENLASIQKDLQNAAADADAARKAKADASNALERTKADVQGFKADAQLATACLRGVLEAVKTAFSSGGAQAALDQATALAGSCRGAAS